MFTGLIKSLGKITALTAVNGGLDAWIQSNDASFIHDLGASISVNGVCSTVIEFKDDLFRVQYLEETLKKTTFSTLKVGDFVNLEPSLTLSSLVGGHLVTGHVDTVGRIIAFDRGHPWGSIRISFDAQFSGLIVEKGSICINGIALTLVDIALNEFSCALIPHTVENTVLQFKQVGDSVNIEFDLVGKYILRQGQVKP
jgi:riboflavin synthase